MSKEQDSIIRKGGDLMNSSRGKKLLIVVIACLAAFALLAGVAVAAVSVGDGGHYCSSSEEDGQCGPRGRDLGRGNHEEMQGVIADTLGISTEELQSELESGKTVAQLAEEKGVSVDAVVDAITAKIYESIDRAVAEGNLDAEKAEEIKSNAPDRVRERIESGRPEDRGQEGKHGPRGLGNHEEMQGIIADTLGLSTEELQSELESGKTVAQLAEEKGVSVDAVVDAITAKINESIDQAVADGNLDAEKAEEIKSGAPDKVRDRIENGPPERGHGPGGENCPGGECGPRGENGLPERPGPEAENAEIG
jgi:uncharacterized protein YidB (DUF937 family)